LETQNRIRERNDMLNHLDKNNERTKLTKNSMFEQLKQLEKERNKRIARDLATLDSTQLEIPEFKVDNRQKDVNEQVL
jgi:hypothetical protein